MGPQLHIGQLGVRLRDKDRSFDLRLADLRIATGATIALTGASGSGKTLALELLGLLRTPDRPADYFISEEAGETDLAALWSQGARSKALAGARGRVFGFVPQTGGLVPFLTVRENIALSQRITKRKDQNWIDTLISRLGLTEVVAMWPTDLSIGQRQRTAIARALAHRPGFVIADEPTSALDPESADDVLSLFLEIAGELNSAVILSSHDLERVGRFGFVRWHLATQTTGRDVVAQVTAESC